MTTDTKANRRRTVKRAIAAAILGAVLALACKALPPDYQGPCEILVNICTGSF